MRIQIPAGPASLLTAWLLCVLPSAVLADVEARLREKTTLTDQTLAALEAGVATELVVRLEDPAIDRDLETLRASVPAEELEIEALLDFHSARFGLLKGEVLTARSEADFEQVRDFPQLPMMVVELHSRAELEELLAHPKVAAVHEDSTYELTLAESLPLIGHAQTVSAISSLNRVAGENTTVVVIDSGVDYTRPAFGSCAQPGDPGCRVIYSSDLARDDGMLDNTGLPPHGTNVSGIVAAVAPGASLAVLDVHSETFNNFGVRFSYVVDAINWTIQNSRRFRIAAMNLSLGRRSGPQEPCSGPLSRFEALFDLARLYDVVPVAASGNDSLTSEILVPACTPGALSVGSVNDRTDTVASCSNSSPGLTMLAPGDEITAAGITLHGTSMAAPHVAGAVAVLRSAYPFERVHETIRRMVMSGKPVTDSRNGLTHPRLDLAAAYDVSPCSINSRAPGCALLRIPECSLRLFQYCEEFFLKVEALCEIHPEMCAIPMLREPYEGIPEGSLF